MKNNIQKIRKAAGLTQTQLGSLLGVEQPTVQRWEKGDRIPNMQDLSALAEKLRCHPGDFFDWHQAVTVNERSSAIQDDLLKKILSRLLKGLNVQDKFQAPLAEAVVQCYSILQPLGDLALDPVKVEQTIDRLIYQIAPELLQPVQTQ